MIDKKTIINTLPNRLQNINNLVDELKPNDYIGELINKYNEELKDYEYIDNIAQFSLLAPGGMIRYIKKYNKELRYGGFLLKIYQKNNKWYAYVKKINNKKYNIQFDSNYIFYSKKRDDKFRDWAELFITEIDNDKYIIK
jgi:hypothetical protein